MHYGWLSLLPPILVIVSVMTTRRVLGSLLVGVGSAAAVLDAAQAGWGHALLFAIPNTFRHVAAGMTANVGRGELVLSVLLLGALVSVIERSGGAGAFARAATRRIRRPAGALLVSWGIGVSVFTSAYFSLLINGAAMRPVFDRLKVSREKLAFMCDVTAAPVNTLVPISGWIAFMITLLVDNLPGLTSADGLAAVTRTVPYNLYCWAALSFSLLLAAGWIPDFGPMATAEARTRSGSLHLAGSTPMVASEDDAPPKDARVRDMVVPLAVSVLSLVVLTLLDTGLSSLLVLVTSFALGLAVAWAMSQLSAPTFLEGAVSGAKSTLLAAGVIVLAVTLSGLLKAPAPEGLGLAELIVDAVRPILAGSMLPLAVFLTAAVVSAAMGSSWGTWALLMPTALPLATSSGVDPYLVAGAVLSGGAFGDHCSPISDTSVLASLAASTDHLQHVRTQIPYALVIAAVAAGGYLVLGVMG